MRSVCARHALVGLLVWCVAVEAVSAGQPYHFIKIDERPSGAEFPIAGAPTINNAGQVAFATRTTLFRIALYRGSLAGPPATPLYDAALPADPFLVFDTDPVINAGGAVAFTAGLKAGGSNLFTGSGGAPTPIYDNPGALQGLNAFSPSMNDAGFATTIANTTDNQFNIFFGNGGATQRPYVTGPVYSGFALAAINNANLLAFTADLTAGGSALLRGDGATTETLADNSGLIDVFLGSGLSFADNGSVVFLAGLDDGRQAALRADGVQVDVIAATSAGGYSLFLEAAQNESGQVGLLAFLDGGGFGLFAGPDRATDAVVKLGDSLFGSTVTALNFNANGMNDLGQYAFFYELADGRTGIAVAAVPEPAVVLLGASGLALSVGAVRRRRGRKLEKPQAKMKV